MPPHQISPTDRTERRLLILAGSFLGAYSLALSLSDAARLRSWQVEYRWQHWIGLVLWVLLAVFAHRELRRRLPERDPYLFATAAMLSGWGVLTIWRLSTGFGLRQTGWLVVVGLASLLALRAERQSATHKILDTLRRYKYVWLTSGLLLTAATLIFGTNPMGAGPRLWLGCCGFYFQPSEPLKLLLIVYLSAYLADRLVSPAALPKLLPLLVPTLIMTGLALLLLIFQRDLGTAAIFLALYAVIVYAGTHDRRVLIFSLLVLVLAGVVGYAIFDVVSLRVDAWINPWLDPSGRSYQIVQSLLAVANGGAFGRGPGMGSPGLVPIAQSDFIFSAISEETGLMGVIALVGLLAMFVNRGTRIALQSTDLFRRLLATGLVVHLVGQSILIIAGNIRLLPLTGVTLPFVSYGGSSLLVSFLELLCLLLISNQTEEAASPQLIERKVQARTSLSFSAMLLLGLASAALVTGWWSVVRAPDLLTRTDNPRRSIGDRFIRRGSILDRHETPLAESVGPVGSILRSYTSPSLGPIIGYTHAVYGQAGLEASLDDQLRGWQGYPALDSWWANLLYGYPPPGLDVRLSLDLTLQAEADQLFNGDPGALVLLNAQTGEVLAISSSPGFDANLLDNTWESLVSDPTSPLFDRAGMGLYPPGNILAVFLLASGDQQAAGQFGGDNFTGCAYQPAQPSLVGLVAAGCPQALMSLAQLTSGNNLLTLLDGLGLFTPPAFPIETLSSLRPPEITDASQYLSGVGGVLSGTGLKVSPLQMALAVAALSNRGELPSPLLVTAYQTPELEWEITPMSAAPRQVFSGQAAEEIARALSAPEQPVWEVTSLASDTEVNPGINSQNFSWFLGGSLPSWKGVPLAIAVVLEDDDPARVQSIGRSMLQSAMNP